jgi:Cu/Ag efflux protein CusF
MEMKRIAIAAIAGSLALAPASHAQVKDSVVAVQETEAVVTVTKVDAKARTVTFRGPKGGIATLDIPPQAQNLDKVKPGQQYRMKYVEAIAVAISKGGEASAGAVEQVKVAPKGGNPGGMMARTVQLAGVIDAIDHANRQVAVRGPKGNVRSLKIAEGLSIDELSAGDRISVVHTESLAIEMVAQAPKKKPAAAKKDSTKAEPAKKAP